MKTRTHFAHRIDMWDDDGENLVEHLAGLEDCRLRSQRFLLPASAGLASPSPCGRVRE
jgi:hypothetical protein